MRCAAGRTNTIEMCRSDGSSSPAPSSNRPGSASAMPMMLDRDATNGSASGAESFARMRAVRSGPCGAPRAMLASCHTLTAASISSGRMLSTLIGRLYARQKDQKAPRSDPRPGLIPVTSVPQSRSPSGPPSAFQAKVVGKGRGLTDAFEVELERSSSRAMWLDGAKAVDVAGHGAIASSEPVAGRRHAWFYPRCGPQQALVIADGCVDSP